MRKVVLYIAVSLDGYIADKNGDVDWLGGQDEGYEGDYGYGLFLDGIDTVILGFRTYQQIVTQLSPDQWVYEGLQSYVVSHQTDLEDEKGIRFVNERPVSLIDRLKAQPGKDIWICGGADIVNQLIHGDRIDEYHLTIMPVLLGDGIRLFDGNDKMKSLKLIGVKSENGVIDCRYERRT